MPHDFEKFPELTNAQMDFYYFQSPHKQIFEDFWATVTKVHDGDTITVKWSERDFDFPIRFIEINTKELSEGGAEARDWLKDQILEDEVLVLVDKNNRVGKYGRLLGRVIHRGLDLNEALLSLGYATKFEQRNDGKFPNIEKELNMNQWLTS